MFRKRLKIPGAEARHLGFSLQTRELAVSPVGVWTAVGVLEDSGQVEDGFVRVMSRSVGLSFCSLGLLSVLTRCRPG